MRYTSLVIELLRARPVLIVLTAILFQAVLWVVVPMVFYDAPPGAVAQTIAIGREYQVGTSFGPPLAFWLADIAFRLVGKHMFGVYLLAQICNIVALWALFLLGRALVGAQHAVMAVLLTMTLTSFSIPGVEFGPDVLTRPLWALALLHYWRAIGQRDRNAWFALSFEIGLLLLTSVAAWILVALLLVFSLAAPHARRAFLSIDPLYALVVIVMLLAPFLIWLALPGMAATLLPRWPETDLLARLAQWPVLLGMALLGLAGILILAAFNATQFRHAPEEAPMIYRAPVDAFARQFIFTFAAAPIGLASLLAALFDLPTVPGGSALHLLPVGLAAVLLGGDLLYLRQQRQLRLIWAAIILVPALAITAQIIVAPWFGGSEVRTALPARAIGAFFADNYERRTGQRLPNVAGETELAELVALSAPSRPHLMFDDAPDRSPWMSVDKLRAQGGLIVWRATDTAGLPPSDIVARYGNLAPEVPRVFEYFVQGRRPLLRVGWAIVRPSVAPATPRRAR